MEQCLAIALLEFGVHWTVLLVSDTDRYTVGLQKKVGEDSQWPNFEWETLAICALSSFESIYATTCTLGLPC